MVLVLVLVRRSLMRQLSLVFLVLVFWFCWESNLQIRCIVRGRFPEDMYCDRCFLADNWQMRFFLADNWQMRFFGGVLGGG